MRPDSEYRRGTVLGLTIAEIFVLLIFLLLLAFLGLANHWQETAKRSSDERDQILYEWRDIFEFHTPDEIKTLTSKAPKLEQQVKNFRNERKTLRTDLEKLRDENAALHEEKEAWQKERETLNERAEVSEKVAGQARRELQKGQNPPCWYETVPAEEGKTREKAHYLFNIAVHENHMIVGRRPTPPGRAYDDNGLPYVEEANQLGLDKIPYNTPLTDAELDEYMRPIYNLGKDGKVRSYSCIFYAQVWDRTSATAKGRWKQAHDNVLEELFGTLEIKKDPWPSSP